MLRVLSRLWFSIVSIFLMFGLPDPFLPFLNTIAFVLSSNEDECRVIFMTFHITNCDALP